MISRLHTLISQPNGILISMGTSHLRMFTLGRIHAFGGPPMDITGLQRWRAVPITDTNELVAVMVLKRSGSKYPGQWTLDRYATACSVPGGHSKLLKHFQRNNTWTSIVTFADLTISEGSLYETTGWTRDSELDPDYRYVYRNQREHKFNFRRARFRDDPAFQYDPDLTEKQLAQMNGLPRVYDCGKIRYVMTNGDIIE